MGCGILLLFTTVLIVLVFRKTKCGKSEHTGFVPMNITIRINCRSFMPWCHLINHCAALVHLSSCFCCSIHDCLWYQHTKVIAEIGNTVTTLQQSLGRQETLRRAVNQLYVEVKLQVTAPIIQHDLTRKNYHYEISIYISVSDATTSGCGNNQAADGEVTWHSLHIEVDELDTRFSFRRLLFMIRCSLSNVVNSHMYHNFNYVCNILTLNK